MTVFTPANGAVVGEMRSGRRREHVGVLVVNDGQLWWVTDDHYGWRVTFTEVREMLSHAFDGMRSTRAVVDGKCVVSVHSDVYGSVGASICGMADLDGGAITEDVVNDATINLFENTAFVFSMAEAEKSFASKHGGDQDGEAR